MKAMVLREPAPIEAQPLRCEEREPPEAGPGELLVRVECCGVCRTDLHVVEGDLARRRAQLVPGHEVVGRVAACGPGARRFAPGDRVGIAWLHRACGRCRFCESGAENLCLDPHFTGWDVDGGYAEMARVPEAFAYRLADDRSARELAPLLCAGIIGFRALRRAGVAPGMRVGLYGFGGSAHIALQVARHWGCEVAVCTRGGRHAELAEDLGACWIGAADEPPPWPLEAAVLFAPAGSLVPVVLEAMDRAGAVAIAGIHLSEIPPLDYQRHLFQERELRSVTANTREDGRALLELAGEIPIRTRTQAYPLEAANRALVDLKGDRVQGAAVLELEATNDATSSGGRAQNLGEAPS